MLTIQLLNLQFYAYHGVYEQEQKLGAQYEVNVFVKLSEKKVPVLHLSETVNYVSVYNLVKQHMQMPRQLLETVATELALHLFATFSEMEAVDITIIKKHPPIAAFTGSVAVNYAIKRSDL